MEKHQRQNYQYQSSDRNKPRNGRTTKQQPNIDRNKRFGDKHEKSSGGTFSKIEQPIFEPIKPESKHNKQNQTKPGTNLLMKEEVEGNVVVPGEIYNFNIGLKKFLELLQPYKDKTPSPKMQIVDNYYLYHYVCSLKNGKISTYSETVKQLHWNGKTFIRETQRTYLEELNDINGYLDYHLITRIIRFQLDQQIFEVIIPRENNNSYPFQPSSQFLINLFSDDCQLPQNVEFMVRRKA